MSCSRPRRYLVSIFSGSTDGYLQDFYFGFLCQSLTLWKWEVTYSHGDRTLVIDAAAALNKLSASGEELSLSSFKKLLRMKFQVPEDILAQAKADTFDMLTKEKVQVMNAITSGFQIHRASLFFKIISKMVRKKNSFGFVVQIRKLLDACFIFTVDKDSTPTTMIDAENVNDLRPNPTVSQFIIAKKNIGMEQEEAQNQERTKRKLISVASDFGKTVFE